MRREEKRGNLWIGVWTGYAFAVVFAVLAAVVVEQDLVSSPWTVLALVVAKFATNTLALVSLRRDWLVLEFTGLNTFTDIVVLTGAIYQTGGINSPLFATYIIEITVIALLSNLHTTVMISTLVVLAYSAMGVLTYTHVLPPQPSPVGTGYENVTLAYLITNMSLGAFVIAVPTLFTSLILRSLVRKEKALEERTRQLMEAQRQKTQFMANVTHELRTPIHGISGLCELLEGGIYGPVSAEQSEAHRSIEKNAGNLLRLVDDLLLLAKSEAARLEYRASDVALQELLPGVVSSVSWMLGHKDVSVETEVAADLPPIATDRGKLNQILINLLANALKFTADGGRVRLTARCGDDDSVAISVADTGVGIAAGELDKIFEAFHQVDGSAERTYGGVGLGLSVVKELTDLLGGEISVTSEIGVGTTFTLHLPRHRDVAPGGSPV